eukprot:scaffold21473_cov80-Skeletonema_marinoi.AAC.1
MWLCFVFRKLKEEYVASQRMMGSQSVLGRYCTAVLARYALHSKQDPVCPVFPAISTLRGKIRKCICKVHERQKRNNHDFPLSSSRYQTDTKSAFLNTAAHLYYLLGNYPQTGLNKT